MAEEELEVNKERVSADDESVSVENNQASEVSDVENAELAKKINDAVETALANQQDMLLRAKAEVQNMRRRCEADVEKAHKFALEKFSVAMLDVMDNMERALQAVSGSDGQSVEDQNIKELSGGVELTMKGMLEAFSKFNIEQINPEGEPFDAQSHQAMSMVENDQVEPNTVVGVMQKGYRLNNRVIRPAMVVVAKS